MCSQDASRHAGLRYHQGAALLLSPFIGAAVKAVVQTLKQERAGQLLRWVCLPTVADFRTASHVPYQSSHASDKGRLWPLITCFLVSSQRTDRGDSGIPLEGGGHAGGEAGLQSTGNRC